MYTMKSFWNQYAVPKWSEFDWIMDHRLWKEDRLYPQIDEVDLITLNPFFIVWTWLLRFAEKWYDKSMREKSCYTKKWQHEKILSEYDIDHLFGITWWYWLASRGNNTVTQESEIFCTVKTPWWKATSKELVYALTNNRLEAHTQKILEKLQWKKKSLGSPAEIFNAMSYANQREIIASDYIPELQTFWHIDRIYPLRISALTARTLQESIDYMKQIYFIEPYGHMFLEMKTDKVTTELQKEFFDVKRDIWESKNEEPDESLLRELKEETGLGWSILYTVWTIWEIKRSSCSIAEIDRLWAALKFRTFYKILCNWAQDTKSIKQSKSELDQNLKVVFHRGSLETVVQSIEYSKIKLWLTPNSMNWIDEFYISEENRLEKMNSHLSNAAGLMMWLIDDIKNWRISSAELKRHPRYAKLIIQAYGLEKYTKWLI